MIKKMYKSSILAFAALLLFLSGCSDQFLRDKKNYNLVDPEYVYVDYLGAQTRVDFIYKMLGSGPSFQTRNKVLGKTAWGQMEYLAQSTEEYGSSRLQNGNTYEYFLGSGGGNRLFDYGGESNDERRNFWITRPRTQNDIVNNNLKYDFMWIEQKTDEGGIYGVIREINDVIEKLDQYKGNFTPEEYNLLMGQCLFWRAYSYWFFVRFMGGVPIVTKVLNPVVHTPTPGQDIYIPRSTTKECIDFICEDLRTAAEMLPVDWERAEINYGRVTQKAALAMMGRARLLYASPLFNRQNDKARWESAYQVNKEARDLASYQMDMTKPNASEWARSFVPGEISHPEQILVRLYSGSNYSDWEQSLRPYNLRGGASNTRQVTAQMIDLFPMADGGVHDGVKSRYSNLPSSTIAYDSTVFWLNRDPRFYRTFAFPGVRWSADADLSAARAQDLLSNADAENPDRLKETQNQMDYILPYRDGRKYQLWSYAWYTNTEEQTNPNSTANSWVADGIQDNPTVYLRKRSDDYDLAGTALYSYDTNGKIFFTRSISPYAEIRYGEVLLNFAESACGADHLDEALEALREVRRRVGYTGDCGLPQSLASDQRALFSAILYERQIELAYEGKRFDDMRRWMLWDGGTGQMAIAGAPQSWNPTGWMDNTCEYLGVEPLNGTRRQYLQVYAQRLGAGKENNGSVVQTQYDTIWNVEVVGGKLDTVGVSRVDTVQVSVTVYNDPIQARYYVGKDQTAKRPGAIDLNRPMTDPQVDSVANFWRANLAVKRLDNLDPYETLADRVTNQPLPWAYIEFTPYMYFMPLTRGAQQNFSNVLQTLGWPDMLSADHGGQFFDPLAE